MAIRGGPDIIEDGLVLHLDAADRNSYAGSGSTIYDLVDSTTNGTLTNSPTFSSANGGSISFDATNETVQLNKKAEDLNIHRSSKNFSNCVWINWN